MSLTCPPPGSHPLPHIWIDREQVLLQPTLLYPTQQVDCFPQLGGVLGQGALSLSLLTRQGLAVYEQLREGGGFHLIYPPVCVWNTTLVGPPKQIAMYPDVSQVPFCLSTNHKPLVTTRSLSPSPDGVRLRDTQIPRVCQDTEPVSAVGF